MYVYRNIYCPPKHTQLVSTLSLPGFTTIRVATLACPSLAVFAHLRARLTVSRRLPTQRYQLLAICRFQTLCCSPQPSHLVLAIGIGESPSTVGMTEESQERGE